MTDKFNPTPADWNELLEALQGEVAEGRLKSITYALVDQRMPDQAVIDSMGSPEITEIACRKTVEEIALAQELAGQPLLAKAIREGLVRSKVLQ